MMNRAKQSMQQQSIAQLPADDTPGFGDYLGIVRKRKKLLFMIGLPIVALGGAVALILPDVYRSSGLIEIEGAENVRQSATDPTLQDAIARQ